MHLIKIQKHIVFPSLPAQTRITRPSHVSFSSRFPSRSLYLTSMANHFGCVNTVHIRNRQLTSLPKGWRVGIELPCTVDLGLRLLDSSHRPSPSSTTMTIASARTSSWHGASSWILEECRIL